MMKSIMHVLHPARHNFSGKTQFCLLQHHGYTDAYCTCSLEDDPAFHKI